MSYYADDEQIIHGVAELSDVIDDDDTYRDEGRNLLAGVIIVLTLCVSGGVMLALIMGLIAFGAWLVGIFS